MDARIDGWMHACMRRWNDRWVDGWMMDGWMGAYVDG